MCDWYVVSDVGWVWVAPLHRWPWILYRRPRCCVAASMDALWMLPVLLLLPVLFWTSSTFVFYFKKCFYVAYMMLLALIAIPTCILKSGGRDIENMRWVKNATVPFHQYLWFDEVIGQHDTGAIHHVVVFIECNALPCTCISQKTVCRFYVKLSFPF